jgi:triosephosphate isomerase
MNTQKKLVVGNWKMNIFSSKEAKKLVEGIKKEVAGVKRVDVVVCPPVVYLSELKPLVSKKISLGVQNIWTENSGSYTGEVSIQHVAPYKISYVIIGHSERRTQGETDTIVSQKVVRTLEQGVTPILCIGESVHDEHGDYLGFIKNQLIQGLSGVTKNNIGNAVIAYEPIWAIGAKTAMQPHDIHQMSLYIKKCLKEMYGSYNMVPRILYGGTVNAENARDIVENGHVEGLLVGRESLTIPGFVGIIHAVEGIK